MNSVAGSAGGLRRRERGQMKTAAVLLLLPGASIEAAIA